MNDDGDMKALLSVNRYTQLEEAQVKSDMRMCFAIDAESSLLTTGFVDAGRSGKVSRTRLRKTLSRLPGIRCCPGFASFNIYPTCASAMEINKLLWETVHAGYYNPGRGNTLFGSNVFVLGLAAELYDFLVHVSLESMEVAIIDFLVLLHYQLTTDGDVVGVEKLRDELVPWIWEQVETRIGLFENGEPKDAERAATLEHLVQISFMTPWRVDVLAGYLSPQDLATLMLSGPAETAARLPSFGPDSVGVRGSALLKMYQDWLVYDEMLCQRLAMGRNAALEAMDRALYWGKSKSMLSEAHAVLKLCEDDRGLFSELPVDLVERAVMPWIVRRSCETIAPRKRRLATLKSLLELSSKFFDELESEDPDFGTDYGGGLYGASYAEGIGTDSFLQEMHFEISVPDKGGADGFSCQMTRESSSSYKADMQVYPLDAKPPRYSRLQRHGGVIDLSVIPGGVDRIDMDGDFIEFVGGEVANALLQPESGPSSPHFGHD